MANETEPRTCKYPGCDVVLEPGPEHRGPPPRYCDNPEHNAHSVFQALKRGEGETPPGMAERLFGHIPDQGS